jgi:light-harvesting complex 1 beta chain
MDWNISTRHGKEVNTMAEPGSLRGSTGFTEEEAREFHGGYMRGFAVFMAVAVVAHWLAYSWKPWI